MISFERHDEWLSCTLKTRYMPQSLSVDAEGSQRITRRPPFCFRPKNGSIILYNRKKVKYRKDGYCWKKRKDGKTTREDHMKLKVQGMEVSTPPTVESGAVPQFLESSTAQSEIESDESSSYVST